MNDTDDQTRTAMLSYAEAVQPPPVEVIFARTPHDQPSTTKPSPQPQARRSRPRRVVALAIFGTLGIGAVTATALFSLPQVTGILPTHSTGASAHGLAPACPAGAPILNSNVQARHGGTNPSTGQLRKPLTVRAGQTLTLDAHLPKTSADRRLTTITLYLVPTGSDTVSSDTVSSSVATGATIRPTINQHNVQMTLAVPPTIPPATYDLLETGTFPGPSICGQPNADTNGPASTTLATIASVVVTPAAH